MSCYNGIDCQPNFTDITYQVWCPKCEAVTTHIDGECSRHTKAYHAKVTEIKLGLEQSENKKMRKQLEKAQCCGSCKWLEWTHNFCKCRESKWFYCIKYKGDKCDNWEVRE